MEISCIQHPPDDRFIIIREWQIIACDGDDCAAALLSFFEYWHNIKLEIMPMEAKVNGTAPDPFGLFQHHTYENLEEGVFLYKRERIRKAIRLLEQIGFVNVLPHPSPYDGWDRTYHLLLRDDVIQRWLDEEYESKERDKAVCEHSSSGPGILGGMLTGQNQLSIKKADGTPKPIGRVRFHVLNFQEYIGATIANQKENWAGRANFTFGKWEVTLDTLVDIDERGKQVNAKGGFVVTHIGDLRRKDGKLFSPADASKVLDFLYWFLSFANGARVGLVLSSGLRYLDHPLWQDWSLRKARAGKYGLSWFKYSSPQQCFSIAEEIFSIWQDEEKRDWLKFAIGIYTDCSRNTSGTDLELTKAQVALELLCWVVLQEENALLSEEGLEKLSAADKIRLMLSWSGIPTSIPTTSIELINAFRSVPGADGPLAITEIRNSIVHPTKKNRNKLNTFSDNARFEAWQLSLWYIELVILKLLGYTGPYTNRVERWQPQYVPWVRPTQ